MGLFARFGLAYRAWPTEQSTDRIAENLDGRLAVDKLHAGQLATVR